MPVFARSEPVLVRPYLAFTAQDVTLSIDDFSHRFLQPAMAAVAKQVDEDVLWNIFDPRLTRYELATA
jgi:hypothetical protein